MRGSNLNPIDLEEAEETVDIEAIKEQKRNQQIIEEAKLSKKPLYLCLAAIKTTIKGDIKHKNMALNRAIIKYFQEKVSVNISNQHFHPRPDPDYFDNNHINPKEFIIYGVDFMTTGQIKDRFNIFQPQIHELMWINSSTCKIKYKTQSQAKTILENIVADPKLLSTKINENQDQYPQGWFTMNSYQIYYFQRQLMIRYSTEKENDMEKQSLAKFDEFQLAQGQLLRHLLQHFNAQQAFQAVIRQVERQRNVITNRHRYFNHQRLNHHRHRSRTRERDGRYNREPMNRDSARRDNRFRKPYQPEQIRLRQRRQIHYEHRPTSMRRRNQDDYSRILKAPARGKTYYDCNDIDYDASNLSFDFNEERQQSDKDDFQDIDLSIPLPNKTHSSRKDPDLSIMNFSKSKGQKENGNNNQDLSFVFNHSKVQNRQDLSILLNNSRTQNNQLLNNDLSILFNNSRVDNNHFHNNELSIMLNNSMNEQNRQNNNDLSIILNNSIVEPNQGSKNDLSVLFNNSKAQHSDNNHPDLSFIFNSSQIQHQDHNNADISMIIAQEPHQINILDTSIKIERNQQKSTQQYQAADTSLRIETKHQPASNNHEDVDYQALLGFDAEEISPIQQNIYDTSFQFEDKAKQPQDTKGSKEKEVDYLDFKRPEKKKKRETRIILDQDDSGY